MSDDEETEVLAESQLGATLHREYWGRTDAPASDVERQHNAQTFGITYRERAGRAHDRCIILCLSPREHRVNQCPSCYGKAVPMDIYAAGLDPMPGRGQRIGRWMGEWFAALLEAVRFPFHRDQEHARALVVDVLQDAMAAGLTAKVDDLADILTVLEGIESQLRAIRDAAERRTDEHR